MLYLILIIAGLLHGFLLDIYILLYFFLRRYVCFQNVGSQHAWQSTSITLRKQGRSFLGKWSLYQIHWGADGSGRWTLQDRSYRGMFTGLRWCISAEPSSPSAKHPRYTRSTRVLLKVFTAFSLPLSLVLWFSKSFGLFCYSSVIKLNRDLLPFCKYSVAYAALYTNFSHWAC